MIMQHFCKLTAPSFGCPERVPVPAKFCHTCAIPVRPLQGCGERVPAIERLRLHKAFSHKYICKYSSMPMFYAFIYLRRQ